MLSFTEENYIKAIYHLSANSHNTVSTNAIAESIQASAASVTDMLKKLKSKKLVVYEKYQGVTLTKAGLQIAKQLVRHHRLWEVFLFEKLSFSWDEVHDMAEQLEHIKSEELINRLDKFLNYPKYDPHGDPIPDQQGNIRQVEQKTLATAKVGESKKVVGVKDSSAKFLQYLDSVKISLGTELEVLQILDFDNSFVIKLKNKTKIGVSQQVVKNLLVV